MKLYVGHPMSNVTNSGFFFYLSESEGKSKNFCTIPFSDVRLIRYFCQHIFAVRDI
jgi:hypothetical protein